VLLCSRDPWQRHTPSNAYTDGSNFWKGMASLLGVSNLNVLMGDLYDSRKGNPVSTQMIEEFLLSSSGKAQVVDAFHRFVYGLSEPSPAPDLWIKDDPAHGGADQWEGTFWDSPDLWIRNVDDGGTDHQSPEYGQDNWFHARVRNKAGAGEAEHFVVTFHSRGFAGTQFVYPADFLPCTTAKAELDLAPGDTRIVKAPWPRELVPPAGSHTCLLASVITRGDHPVASRQVCEHNNLAQKNLAVVDLLPNTFMILPIVIANWRGEADPMFDLEVWKPRTAAGVNVSLIHRSKEFFRPAKAEVKRFQPEFTKPALQPEQIRLECGGYIPGPSSVDKGRIMTSDTADLVLRRFPDSWEARFPESVKGKMVGEIPPFTQKVVGLKVALTAQAEIAQSLKLHFVQRHSATQQLVGGVAVQVNVGMRTHRKFD
jgi:hypothetical protein